MFHPRSLLPLLGISLVAAAAIWVAGVQLSNTTDIPSRRLALGQALDGAILLTIASNLREIAITASAAAIASHDGVDSTWRQRFRSAHPSA